MSRTWRDIARPIIQKVIIEHEVLDKKNLKS